MEIKLWVAIGLIMVLVPSIGWLIRWAVNRVVGRLDRLVEQNNTMTNELVRQNGEIKSVTRRLDGHDETLKDHSKRIWTLETKHQR